MWIMVVLTLSGGYSVSHGSLAACTNTLLRITTSQTREAYCMSPGRDDRIYYVHHGRVVGFE
jgi:hypothetical protein